MFVGDMGYLFVFIKWDLSELIYLICLILHFNPLEPVIQCVICSVCVSKSAICHICHIISIHVSANSVVSFQYVLPILSSFLPIFC